MKLRICLYVYKSLKITNKRRIKLAATSTAKTFACKKSKKTKTKTNKKNGNFLTKTSRLKIFGTNFWEKTLTNLKKVSFLREKTFANGQNPREKFICEITFYAFTVIRKGIKCKSLG